MSNYQVIHWDTPTQECAKCSTVIVFDQAAQAVETWHGIEVAVCLVLGHVYSTHHMLTCVNTMDVHRGYFRADPYPYLDLPVPKTGGFTATGPGGSWLSR